jgi:hypothetical protein
MEQELFLEQRGDAVHLVLRHTRDSFVGHVLGNRLHLTEVAPRTTGHEQKPGNGNGNGLQPGQYVFGLSDGESEMHALLPASQLPEIAAAVRDLHIDVAAGAELIANLPPPEVAEPEPRRRWARTAIAVAVVVLILAGAAYVAWWALVARETVSSWRGSPPRARPARGPPRARS